MSNPVVLITGGLTGIGRAAAVAFANKGAKVMVAGRRDEAGKALVKELRSFGSDAEFVNADVRKEDDIRALVFFFFFQAEDGIRDATVTGVQTCALPICPSHVMPVVCTTGYLLNYAPA